jgi:serine protease Do/serine protease DegQ
MTQLIQYGEVKRGMLGVQLQDMTPAIAEDLGLPNAKGTLVGQVVEGSPAERAGIKAGDVITAVNGKTVNNSSETRNTIGLLRIGEKVDISLLRDGQPRRVTAVIGERDGTGAAGAAEVHPAFEGATLGNAPANGGVTVQTVAEGSPAAESGLRPNDVILAIGRVRVTNLEQLRAALKGRDTFAITIRRGNSTLVFPVG